MMMPVEALYVIRAKAKEYRTKAESEKKGGYKRQLYKDIARELSKIADQIQNSI